MVTFFICIICLHFPNDWRWNCPYQRHAPGSWVALFGSDWDVWNKKKDSVSNIILMTCSIFRTFPPKVSQWMMQLKFWNCRVGDCSISHFLLNSFVQLWQEPNKLKVKFSQGHFHFINTCFRFWEHISSTVSYMYISSNYFLWGKKGPKPAI